jgi:hypothetical protein
VGCDVGAGLAGDEGVFGDRGFGARHYCLVYITTIGRWSPLHFHRPAGEGPCYLYMAYY